MNQNSRTKNSIFNFIANFSYQFVVIALSFITRRVFIKSLGVEFLGISGLFNNILSVLSIAELGIGGSMYYAMYKAIAKDDKEKIKGLTTYYKSLYLKIALVIFSTGMLLVPFLRSIVKLDRNIPHLEIYYIIGLLNSVFSYLFVYKTTIIHADQRSYKLKAFNISVTLIRTFIELFILIFVKKYMVYIIISPIFVLFSNIVSVRIVEKHYPFIKEKGELKEGEKKVIWSNIKAMFLYKISGVILNNTDSILISILINTNMVGFYSNYSMITHKLFSIIYMFFNSIGTSIGNMNATEKNERIYSFFRVTSLLAYWLFAFASIGIVFVGEDVIRMITGENRFVLSYSILVAVVIYFYLNVSKSAIYLYRETTGLFKFTKYSILASALLNIIFSVILGKIYGLFGILIATSISRLLADFWYEPYVLYKKIFKKSPKEYFSMQGLYLVLTGIVILVLIPIFNLIQINHLYIKIAVKFVVCTIIVNSIFIIVFRKTEEYKYIKEKIISILNSFRNKVISNDSN